MPTSNELIFDSVVKQQVNLQRLSKGEANKLIRTLAAADKELSGLISSRLVEGQLPDFTTRRWQAMVTEIGRMRTSAIKAVGGSIDKAMSGTVDFALKDTKALYQAAIPVEVNFATPPLATIRELTRSKPFGGADMVQTLGEWMVNLKEADSGRIVGAVRQGVINGETIPQIQRRVMKATQLTRQNSEAIARTAVNHAGNTARQEFFNENEEVIEALRWTATLDGRTSAICRARDGQHDAVEIGGDMSSVPQPHISGSPRRPPAHLRCRSIMIAILDADTIAELERPFVTDSRTRAVREKGFRADAKQRVGKEKWSEMSRKQRAAEMSIERKDWTRKNVGTVPADTTYDEWLRRQSPEFQNEVLGEVKAEGFRNGITMDQYVDRQGNELTITDLRENIHTQGKMPAPTSKEDLAGPGTPSTKQLEVEAKRQKTIEKNQLATAKREKRAAVKKAETERRRAAAAERKAEKEAKAAKRSEKARKAAELRDRKRAARERKRLAAAKRKAKKQEKLEKAEKAKAKKKPVSETELERNQREFIGELSEDELLDPDIMDRHEKALRAQLELDQFSLKGGNVPEEIVRVRKGLIDKELKKISAAKTTFTPDRAVFVSKRHSQRIQKELRAEFPNYDPTNRAHVLAMRREHRKRLSKITPMGQDPKEYGKWIDSLSDDEFEAFEFWTGEGNHKLIRDYQRGRPLEKTTNTITAELRGAPPANLEKLAKRHTDALESALARAPKYKGTVYRGLTSDLPASDAFRPGMKISEGAFASGTFHPGTASEFAVSRAVEFDKHPVIFKIKGSTRGTVIQNLGNPTMTHEAEILLSKGLKYEVVSTREVMIRANNGLDFKVTEVLLRVSN